jgi:outer membrane protein assembly factor BamB
MTGDLIKGSVTLDPNGFPLLYFGSRDNYLRVVALDRDEPTELYSINGNDVPRRLWNNDWDGNPSIVDGILFEGGENGYFYAVELNRRYGSDGLVQVEPEILVRWAGWTDELVRTVGDNMNSIENSVAIFEDRAYFANGQGRVVGLDISRVRQGEVDLVFDFWVGDDVDASIVVDEEGMIYVAVELERHMSRATELGQLLKLDPENPTDPVIWGVHVPPVGDDPDGGIWATPALGTGVLYVPTHTGRLLAVDRETGEITWEDSIGWHAWSSPLVVDGHLVVANCTGEMRSYSLGNPRQPQREWTIEVGDWGCIESTPALWRGRMVVGRRDGYIYGIGD